MRNVALGVAAATVVALGLSAPAMADTINFGQFGPDFASVPDLATGVTSGGSTFVVTDLALGFTRLDEGNGWAGEFAHGTPLLYDNGVAGPVSLTFVTPLTSLSGISAQANLTGAYTATETFLGVGGVTLGIESYTSNNALGPEGSIPTFAAFNAGGALITEVVYTTTNDGAGFALGGSSVPEPASWTLMFLGAGAIGFAARRRKSTIVAA